MNSAIPVGTRIVIFHPGGNDRSNKKSSQYNDSKGSIETIVQTLLDRKRLVLLTGSAESRRYVRKFKIPAIENITKLAPDDFQIDGMHLTANGYKIAAEKMFPYVKELLEKVRANDALPVAPGDASPRSGSGP